MTTAPVKLHKSQNSKHALHSLAKFARASVRSLEEVAAVLGPAEVTFHYKMTKLKSLLG